LVVRFYFHPCPMRFNLVEYSLNTSLASFFELGPLLISSFIGFKVIDIRG
jgi:hypothetical protein